MNRLPAVIVSLAAVSLGAATSARQAQPPSFSTATRAVAVYATVTNPGGRLVTDLMRDDFAVADNGKAQTLTTFANDIQPITAIVLLDRSSSMKPNFDLEAQGAEAFVRAMGGDDKLRIGSFSNQVQIDPPDFSSDFPSFFALSSFFSSFFSPTSSFFGANGDGRSARSVIA